MGLMGRKKNKKDDDDGGWGAVGGNPWNSSGWGAMNAAGGQGSAANDGWGATDPGGWDVPATSTWGASATDEWGVPPNDPARQRGQTANANAAYANSHHNSYDQHDDEDDEEYEDEDEYEDDEYYEDEHDTWKHPAAAHTAAHTAATTWPSPASAWQASKLAPEVWHPEQQNQARHAAQSKAAADQIRQSLANDLFSQTQQARLNNILETPASQYSQLPHKSKHGTTSQPNVSKNTKSNHAIWDMAARLPSTIVEEESIGGQLNDQRRVHFSPAKGFAGLQGYDRQSKTMSHATWGMNNTPFQQPNNLPRTSNFTDTSHFVESNGLGLRPAMNALFPAGYGQRKAKDRIFWVFPPENDRRVSLLLRWINDMKQAIGVYGLQKFLQSRERGALVTNANYRKPGHETEPAWDWLTFDQLQTSRDKTFQELVACYDPAEIVVVFVYLPSESGRSVAMWRRKIPVPAHVRQTHQRQIDEVKHHLRRFEEYVVHVDELPPDYLISGRRKVPTAHAGLAKHPEFHEPFTYEHLVNKLAEQQRLTASRAVPNHINSKDRAIAEPKPAKERRRSLLKKRPEDKNMYKPENVYKPVFFGDKPKKKWWQL